MSPKRSRTRPEQEILPTSQKLDLISKWLQKMLDAFPSKGRITAEEISDWYRDLTPFSGQAIEYAFESHRRCGLFFPLYGQIINLCVSYSPPDQDVISTERCDSLCKLRHGRGYGGNDMMWMFKRMEQVYAKGDTPDTEELLNELDRKRPDGATEWRKNAGRR